METCLREKVEKPRRMAQCLPYKPKDPSSTLRIHIRKISKAALGMGKEGDPWGSVDIQSTQIRELMVH